MRWAMGVPSEAVFRPLVAADIPFAMELKNIAGWNQTARDWAGYLEFEPAGCFVAEVGGRSAGTATAIRYGDEVGWVGMVLVHPDCRRLGLGTGLLRHVIDYLRHQGTKAIKLDATPMGRKVYLPLGFRDEYEVDRFEGSGPETGWARQPGVKPMQPGELCSLADFDRPIFGAARERVLVSLSSRNPGWCWVARDRDGVAGYLIAREGHEAVQLGPWVARDHETADRLLMTFLAEVQGRRVLVDVPAPNHAGQELVRRRGMVVQRSFTRMCLGENLHPGDPSRVFGTAGAEKG